MTVTTATTAPSASTATRTLIDWKTGIAAELVPWAEHHGIGAGRGAAGSHAAPDGRGTGASGDAVSRGARRRSRSHRAAVRYNRRRCRASVRPSRAGRRFRIRPRRSPVCTSADSSSCRTSTGLRSPPARTSSDRFRSRHHGRGRRIVQARPGELRGARRGRRWAGGSAATSCCTSPSRSTTIVSRRERSTSIRCGSTAATTAPAATVRRRRPLIGLPATAAARPGRVRRCVLSVEIGRCEAIPTNRNRVTGRRVRRLARTMLALGHDADLGEDVGDVVAHRLRAEHEAAGDRVVVEAFGDQAEHVELAVRQLGKRAVGGRAAGVGAARRRRQQARGRGRRHRSRRHAQGVLRAFRSGALDEVAAGAIALAGSARCRGPPTSSA